MTDISAVGPDAVAGATAATGVSHPRDDPFPLMSNMLVVTLDGTKIPSTICVICRKVMCTQSTVPFSPDLINSASAWHLKPQAYLPLWVFLFCAKFCRRRCRRANWCVRVRTVSRGSNSWKPHTTEQPTHLDEKNKIFDGHLFVWPVMWVIEIQVPLMLCWFEEVY